MSFSRSTERDSILLLRASVDIVYSAYRGRLVGVHQRQFRGPLGERLRKSNRLLLLARRCQGHSNESNGVLPLRSGAGFARRSHRQRGNLEFQNVRHVLELGKLGLGRPIGLHESQKRPGARILENDRPGFERSARPERSRLGSTRTVLRPAKSEAHGVAEPPLPGAYLTPIADPLLLDLEVPTDDLISVYLSSAVDSELDAKVELQYGSISPFREDRGKEGAGLLQQEDEIMHFFSRSTETRVAARDGENESFVFVEEPIKRPDIAERCLRLTMAHEPGGEREPSRESLFEKALELPIARDRARDRELLAANEEVVLEPSLTLAEKRESSDTSR